MTHDAAILIEQKLDLHGQAAPERYRKPIVATVNLPRTSLAIDALVRLGASVTEQPGEFDYRDPNRGSGGARLEGFGPDEIRVIHDYFRVEAARLRLGIPTAGRLPLDQRPYFTRPGTTRNPVPMIVVGVVILVFAVTLGLLTSVGPMRAPGDDVTWVYAPLFGLLAVGGTVIIVQHARRVRPWFALRSSFQNAGEAIPVGLRLKD
ncbi:hypothetical protein [Microcella sp.]|uniref:hypothetical protein n=1 Tax=Microcella sp. TaxID=1913979 RepID=UPI003F719C40